MTAHQPKVAKVRGLPTGFRHLARMPLAFAVAYLSGCGLWLLAFEDHGPAVWALPVISAMLIFGGLKAFSVLDRQTSSDISAHDLTDIVAVIDGNGRLLRWNVQAESLAGFDGGWQGTRLVDAVPAEDQPVFQAGLAAARANGRADFECRLRSAQETALPCLWAASTGRDGEQIVLSARIIVQQDQPVQHLAERERRYRYMVEMAPHLIAVVAGGRIAYINETGSRLLGQIDPARLIGEIWGNFHPPATREGECLRRTDGELLNVELSEVPILWDEQVASLFEARDITDLVRIDRARRRSEELLKGIVDNAVDAIITADDQSVIQSFNPAAERIFGWKAAEIIGQRIEILMPEPMGAIHAAVMRRYMQGGESKAVGFGRELVAKRKDGSQFPIELALSDLRLGDRRLFTSVIRDISERKRSQERLVIAEKVLESTSEGVMVTDRRGIIVWVNNAFCTISGYRKDEVIGENASLLKSGLQGPDFYRAMWACIHEKGQWSGEIWNRRKDGEAYPEWLTIRAIPAEDEESKPDKFVGVFSDISKHKRAEETIKTLTYYDAVTRLPNRYLFQDRLSQALERAHRNGRLVALVLIGLDRFRTVNETLGHQTGDAMLREVADRLLASVRGEDTVARLRGDTFCCVLTDLALPTDAHPVITRIMDAFTSSFILGGHELFVTASLGISLYPLDGIDTDDLIQKAETAMNRSKETSENRYNFYTPEMNANSMERLRLETDLRKAIGRNELMLHYQPKVETATGRIVGAEALMRWRHHELGMISPGQFIPIAEDTGLIVSIGLWALHAACRQIRAWQNSGAPVVRIAVNLSALQFRQPNLVEAITQVLAEHEVDPALIELELTESAIMQNADVTIRTLNQLHERGFRLSIDDFGTGYSSLSYLKRFPIDKLKIDRSFVQDLGSNSAGEEIVAAIIAMAHSLTLSVIAEGVETEGQLAMLKQMKCDEIQGFYFSKPVPADQFESYLRKGALQGKAAVA